jgi:hypothetical protein
MSSSVQEKVRAVEKDKKRQRTLAREGALDAIRQRQEPENNQPEHKEVDVREIPKETSNSNSIESSWEIKEEKPKKKSSKKSKKKE